MRRHAGTLQVLELLSNVSLCLERIWKSGAQELSDFILERLVQTKSIVIEVSRGKYLDVPC